MRDGLRRLIEATPGWEVVGETGDGLTALKETKQIMPDLVLMDINLPGISGVEVTIQLVENLPHIAVVALSANTSPDSVARMLRAGARAYLPKQVAFEELIVAMNAAMARTYYVSPHVAGFVLEKFVISSGQLEPNELDELTPTERLVLQQIASGKQTKDIAQDLGISPRTVDNHRAAIYNKLKVRGIAALTRIAIQNKLVDLD